ncbi:PIN domain-containing protein (plasmid) [Kovacikia minuta CCNUW1]|uniref:type II toxin-antitoxin system VapC family toxin n=1 Tax=Kovacikia minuta TaxID=2931930 RepID=UPI001CCAB7E8|nr:PIN domain-containing protein [Kovacikia minuta]UBF30513.1 PIN domain-containing protein [Kovacikia minuta CCNUW1]
MRRQVIVDTGVLVAAIDRRDAFHEWAKTELATIEKPLLTCEAAITETYFLLQNVYGGREAIVAWLETGLVRIAFSLGDELQQVGQLLKQYESVPMSLADGCLVRMAEQFSTSSILTLDSDFRIYRKERNQPIPVIMPVER